MIKVTITNDILNSIIEIELNRYKMSLVELSHNVLNKLRKNSKKKSSYASNKIEGEYSANGRPLVTVEKSTQYAEQVHLTQ